MNLRIASGLIAVLMFVGVGIASAGDKDKDKDDQKSTTITGCLQRSDADRQYVLVTEDGKSWDLRGNEHDMNTLTGEKVSVSGDVTASPSTPHDINATSDRDNDKDRDKDEARHNDKIRAGHITVKSVTKVEGTCHPWKQQ